MFQKQQSTQEMFEKRKGSLRKLAAKQTRPVQPVAPRPEAFVNSPNSSPGKETPISLNISVYLPIHQGSFLVLWIYKLHQRICFFIESGFVFRAIGFT